jgi:hypothetical protein
VPALAVVERIDVLEHRRVELKPHPAATANELFLEVAKNVWATALS